MSYSEWLTRRTLQAPKYLDTRPHGDASQFTERVKRAATVVRGRGAASDFVGYNAGAAYSEGTAANTKGPQIEIGPVIPNPPPVYANATVLTYSSPHGDSIVWSGITFTRNTSLPNYSYTSTTASIPITQVPNPADLIGVIFGNSVTSIDGDYEAETGPFAGTSLKSITIPNSVESIGDYAFAGCTSLTSIIIPNLVTTIGDYAFYSCSSLTSITIPNLVTTIGDGAFYYCTSLTSVIIGNSVETIGDYAFERCTSLTSITIPNLVTTIGDYAFDGSGLTTVTIANEQLLNIQSPDTDVSFYGKNGVTTVPPELTVLTYSGNHGDSIMWDTITFTKNTSLPDFSYTNSTVLSIPGTVVPNHSDLIGVILGNSVTSIADGGTYPYGAFSDCNKLVSIIIPNSVESIGDYAFNSCTKLVSITIPNSVTSIGDYAFGDCTSLTSIIIPNLVTSIDDGAFISCSSLTSITIPNSVETIGDDAFNSCTSLTSVIIGNSVETIGDYAFESCTSLTSIIIPNLVTSIGDGAFYSCSSLTSVILGSSVESIGISAFYNCSSLTSIIIPNLVTSIGSNAFERSGLQTVTIANGQLGKPSPASGVSFFGVFVTTVLPIP